MFGTASLFAYDLLEGSLRKKHSCVSTERCMYTCIVFIHMVCLTLLALLCHLRDNIFHTSMLQIKEIRSVFPP